MILLLAASNEALAPHVASVLLTVFGVGILLAFARLAWGPTLPDRVVALEVIATLIVGMIGLYAIASSEPVFLRVAMIVALISFIGTVAFAYYLQRLGTSA